MIYVVIATINNLEHLQALLMALSKVELPLRIVIVDNGSEAAMAEWLGQFGRGGVQVIFNERNIGAAAAWNLGIRVALANAASAILVCGSDTQPFPGTVERLAAHLTAGVPFITGTAVPYDSPELRDPIALPGPDDVLFAAPDFSFFMMNPVMIETVARWDASLEWAVLKETKERPAVLPPPWTWGLFDERYWPCLAPSTRVLRDDLSWVAIGDLHAGDGLVAVEPEAAAARLSRSYVYATAQALRRFKARSLRIIFEDGREVVCTPNHRWLAKRTKANGSKWKWRTAAELQAGHRICAPLRPWETATSYDAGWLAGIFDGEGCLRTGSGRKMRGVSFSQKEGVVLQKALRILAGMKVSYSQSRRRDGVVSVELNSKEAMFHVLGHLRPERLLQRRAWESMRVRSGAMDLAIARIEPAGICEVVDLCTSTGTFIAEGLVSHNSYFEDNDYHLRMHRAGLLAARDPAALFAHNCSLTINTHPELARLNREVTFARNADLFKAKWGGTPQEVAATSARPLNISEAEWHRQTGGRAVMQLPQSQLVAQAEEVYSRYGIMVRSDAPA